MFNDFDSDRPHARKCTQDPLHSHERILYICLSSTCKGSKRLLCNRCLRDLNHRRHQIALIHRDVEPFSRLCINNDDGSSRDKYHTLSKSINSIEKSFNKAENSIINYFSDLRRIMIDPIKTICNTYTNQEVQDCIRILENDLQSDENIDKVAYKINFLLSIDPTMFEASLATFQEVQNQSVKIFNECNEKISKYLESMKQKLTAIKLDQIGGRRAISFSKLESVQLVAAMPSKPQEQVSSGRKGHLNLKKKQFTINVRAGSKVLKAEPQSSEQEYIENNSERYGDLGRDKGERNKDTIEMQIQNHENTSSFGEGEESEEKIELIIKGEEDLRSRQSVTYNKVTDLVIEDLSKNTSFLEKILPQFTNLKSIYIYDYFACNEKNIIKLFDFIPKSIKTISLSCNNSFSLECLTTLHKRKITDITYLQYFFDMRRDLQKIDEGLYFKQKEEGIRIEPLKLRTTNSIFQYFPKIKNLWLPIKNYNRVKKIIPFKNFEDLILGELQPTIQKLIAPPEKLLVDLEAAINLRSLALLNVQIRDREFVNLVQRNDTLQTLYLEYCHEITQSGMTEAIQYSKIVNFSIKECPQIKGSFIQEQRDARIFIMDHARREIEEILIFKSFFNLNSLIYLNLFGNIHFDDSLLASLRKCGETLRSLNIGHTSISKHFSNSMAPFSKLEVLCLDQNQITIESIIEGIKHCQQIEKLSICGFNGQKEKGGLTLAQLEVIGSLLPNLTHLCIKYCYRLEGKANINLFKRLKYVQIDEGSNDELVNSFRQVGVTIIDDE